MSVSPEYTGRVTGLVYEDQKANGLLDKKDGGLGGVVVQLINVKTKTLVSTTTTDFKGAYLFDDVPANKQYQVRFVNPNKNAYRFSSRNHQASGPLAGRLSRKFWVEPKQTVGRINTGLYKFAKIGDRVFHDMDGDGKQDAGEGGIAGIKIQLLSQSGEVLRTTTSNNKGNYVFDDLKPSRYQVRFEAKDGYKFSPKDVGRDPSIDSDGPVSDLVWLKSGEWNDKIDAGLYRPATVGDKVWLDEDCDGIQDANEPGLAGITVKLTRPNGKVVRTTTTDANGEYLFDHVRPGPYRVMFNNPDSGEFEFTTPNVGNNDSVDSDANVTTGQTAVFRLKSGETDLSIDAGLKKIKPPEPAKLGDFVFNDLDQDGIQDANEPGIAGATVKLLDANGGFLADTVTDGQGMYMFNDLTPGDYKVMFVQPDGFDGVSPFQSGGNSAADSDADPTNGLMSDVVTLDPGEFDRTIDAGFFKTPPPEPAKLGDFVFNDLDQDGIQDANEPGIAGATVKLLDANGGFLEDTVTDGQGMYMFNDLTPGDYKVMFVQPEGFDGISPFQSGGNSAADSDADPTNGLMSDVVMLDPGEFDSTIDAGFFKSAQPGINIEKLVRVTPPGGNGQPGQDVCDTVGKPGTLTFEYIPFDQFVTQQSSKKGEGLVNNGIDDDGTSFVVVSDKEDGDGEVYFSGNVSVGDIFDVTSEKFSSNSFISIFDDQGGPLLQSARYHTSCSAPIVLGDQIYGLTLVGVQGEDGSASLPAPTDFVDADDAPGPSASLNSSVEFQYRVTNTGDTALSNVQVTDDRLTNVVFEGGDDNSNSLLDLDETWLYSATERATHPGTITNKGTVTGEANGIAVMDMDPANYTVVEKPPISGDLCDVLGKPEALIFTYRSDEDSNFGDLISNQKSDKAVLVGSPDDDGLGYVVVSNGKFKSSKGGKSGKSGKSKGGSLAGSSIFFQGEVSAGDSFSASGDFKSETLIQVFEDEAAFNSGATALQTIEYHTSCSQPIQIGDQLGSVLLSGYQGEDGSTGVGV